jgi:hypothetical protein
MTKTYLVEDIFQDIPDDPDHVLMTIPPEICEQAGMRPGDVISIEVKDGQMIITKA